MNKRLSRIFTENNILKGRQFAGLPEKSTFEPIRIINEIIEDASYKNKELWILSQDLGKAYDRVNIYMLKKAMERLKIPEGYINLIASLFTGRKNTVITNYGNTDPYEVLIGIDQGEIISPLLWCLYYDPLLCRIEKLNLGYQIETKYRKNIYDKIFQEDSVNFSNMAYMDDTQWISDKKEKLEKILEIADSFYNINDIQVNKEKSELLLRMEKIKNRNVFDYTRKIELKFGCTNINITPKHPSEAVRILGVWYNMNNNKRYNIGQARVVIQNISKIIKHKMITDKHMTYIFNNVIIPKIEYITQMAVITERDLKSIYSPIRRIFKNKLRLASSSPNAIMDNYWIYNFRSIYSNQIQAKINNFFIQLNDPNILGKITK